MTKPPAPEKRPLGKTGLHVSEVGFGALEIGRDWAGDVNDDPAHPPFEEASRTLNGLLDLGIDFIDTAPAYWSSEEFIGRAIAHRRSEFVLATKVGEHCDRNGSHYDYSAQATAAFIDRSLGLLRTDVIDLIQIHSASMETLERGETLEALQRARDAGKVRFLGISGGVAECIRAIEIGAFDTVQFPYNLLNREAEERLLPLARERGVGTIVMRPLAGGKLTAKCRNLADAAVRDAIAGFARFAPGGTEEGLAELALAYVLSHADVSTVIAGSRRLERLEGNLRAARTRLDADQLAAVRSYADSFQVNVW